MYGSVQQSAGMTQISVAQGTALSCRYSACRRLEVPERNQLARWGSRPPECRSFGQTGVRRQLRYCTVVVAPIKTDGSMGDPADGQSIPTSLLGPHQAQDGPLHAQLVPKRFADSGHDAPHAHAAQTDPAGNYL